jgi:hypothetical protein
MSTGNWTIERDDDLTGSYAFSEDGDWIAFDDELVAQIKVRLSSTFAVFLVNQRLQCRI